MALYVSRKTFRIALADFLTSLAISVVVLIAASLVLLTTSVNLFPVLRLAIMSGFGVLIAVAAGVTLPNLFRSGYRQRNTLNQLPY